MFPESSGRRGGGSLFRGGFFFRGLRAPSGGAGVGVAAGIAAAAGAGAGVAVVGASLRALKELMNSRALGESPRKFLRCSAAASFGSAEL